MENVIAGVKHGLVQQKNNYGDPDDSKKEDRSKYSRNASLLQLVIVPSTVGFFRE